MMYRTAVCLTLTASLLMSAGCEKKEAAPADTTPASSAGQTLEAPAAVELPKYDSLHDLMEANADNLKFLFRNTESGDAQQLIQHATELRALLVLAHTMTPEQVERAEDDEKTKLAEAYATHLDEVSVDIDAYISAITDDDRAAAGEALTRIKKVVEDGHKALGVDEDH